MCYCRGADKIAELGQREGELIRRFKPILNTQIPKAEDWRKWENKEVDARAVLERLLQTKREE